MRRWTFANVSARISLWMGGVLWGILLQVSPGVCEEPARPPSVVERVAALEKKVDAPSLWKTLGFSLSGFVDAAYTQNFNNPSSNLNQLHIFDTDANGFMAHLTQLMLEKPADPGGGVLDRGGFRARLLYGLDARVSRARPNFQPGTTNNELDFQEMYGQYIIPIGNGLDVKFGKINTLIGYEVIASVDNPNFSRTFMFGLGQAFTTTGVRFSYQFNPMVSATVGVINGWDKVDINNRTKGLEWLLALTPHKRVGINVYGSWTHEQPNSGGAFTVNGDQGIAPVPGITVPTSSCPPGAAPGSIGCDPSAPRLAIGGILTLKATEQTTLVLEPYYVNEANISSISKSHNGRWNGFVGYLIHDFTDQWSLRGRGEIFEDAGGTRTCGGAFNIAGGTNTCFGATNLIPANPVGQTLWETTWTLQYKPVPPLITRLEFRYDKSNHNVFQNGSVAANNQETMSVEVIYLF